MSKRSSWIVSSLVAIIVIAFLLWVASFRFAIPLVSPAPDYALQALIAIAGAVFVVIAFVVTGTSAARSSTHRVRAVVVGSVSMVAVGVIATLIAFTVSASPVGERLATIPDELSSAPGASGIRPTVVWADHTDDWLLLTWGGSSCPWIPAEIRQTAERSYVIRLERTGGLFCTADESPAAYRIPAPVSRGGGDVVVDIGPGTVVALRS